MSQNVKPIIMTSVTCMLLETIITYLMVDWLVNHQLINMSQLSFLNAWRHLANIHYVQGDQDN